MDGASPSKRPRGPDEAPAGAVAARPGIASVLDVEMLLHSVLSALDAPSVASLVEVLARNRQWLRCLQQPALWDNLTLKHFGGPRVADNDPDVAVATYRPLFLIDPADSGEETSENEEDDGEEGEDDPPPELVPVDESTEEEEEEGEEESIDDPSVRESAAVADDATSSAVAENTDDTATASPAAAPATASAETFAGSPFVLSLACGALKEFLLSTEEWTRFEENVVVVSGDIGEIAELGGRAIDGIAFPTTPYLRNPHIGSAAVVHRRAGDELARHIRRLNTWLNVSQVVVTPGFDAGVAKLIHVVGPGLLELQCYQLLQLTYKNIMLAARQENLQCLAMTSVSTGNLGVPYKEGAQMALRAIQRFLSQEKWPGVVGFVCFEPEAMAAFTEEKKAVIQAFNVVPPFPDRRVFGPG